MSARTVSPGDFLCLAREVLGRGGHLEIQVRGRSMRPTLEAGDAVVLGPTDPRRSAGRLVLAEVDGQPMLHRLARWEQGEAVLIADGCGRSDRVGPAQLIGEVRRIHRARRRWLPRLWRWARTLRGGR